jgi:hypothetical protein
MFQEMLAIRKRGRGAGLELGWSGAPGVTRGQMGWMRGWPPPKSRTDGTALGGCAGMHVVAPDVWTGCGISKLLG